jgi:cobalt-precorrin 5A hydrolase/precorrin-3B C17-methyltransferase
LDGKVVNAISLFSYSTPKIMKDSPAIIILGQNSLPLARQLTTALPGAKLYGLSERTTGVDVSFTNFGDTLRELFAAGTPIIGICAAGILIRTLAPMLTDKRQEPPVLAVAEDGSAVVPLLGGLHGVNEMARQIATVLGVEAAITTTGDIRFRTALLSPPKGYHLANPEDAKKFISDLLGGATVRVLGTASWLTEGNLPIKADGNLLIQVTEKSVELTGNCLVYHPATLALGISGVSGVSVGEAVDFIQEMLADAGLSKKAIAGVFSDDAQISNSIIQAIAQNFHVPARFFNNLEIKAGHDIIAQEAALTASGVASNLIASKVSPQITCCISISPEIINPETLGRSRGQLYIVGIGPGGQQWMSPQVKEILRNITDLVGYSTYLNLAGSLLPGQKRHDSDNREEIARARLALDLAATGRKVAVISSGDPGIYAMAAAVFEVLDQEANPKWDSIDIQVAPGISAVQAAAAQIGAPIGHDFCLISLSDILKPWSIIEKRITAAAEADFAIAFYNPVSKQRTWQLTKAREILLQYRSGDTPVVLARNVSRVGEEIKVRRLEELSEEEVDMRTLVLVGSSKTRIVPRKDGGVWVYTPRRYDIDG